MIDQGKDLSKDERKTMWTKAYERTKQALAV